MKKQTKCYQTGCKGKATHKYYLKISKPKASASIEGKFCEKHFKAAKLEYLEYLKADAYIRD